MGELKQYSVHELFEAVLDRPAVPLALATGTLYMLCHSFVRGYLEFFGADAAWFDLSLSRLVLIAFPGILLYIFLLLAWVFMEYFSRRTGWAWRGWFAFWCALVVAFLAASSSAKYISSSGSSKEFVFAFLYLVGGVVLPLLRRRSQRHKLVPAAEHGPLGVARRPAVVWVTTIVGLAFLGQAIGWNAGAVYGMYKSSIVRRIDNLASGDVLGQRLVFTDGAIALASSWSSEGRQYEILPLDKVIDNQVMSMFSARLLASKISQEKFVAELAQIEREWNKIVEEYADQGAIPEELWAEQLEKMKSYSERMRRAISDSGF